MEFLGTRHERMEKRLFRTLDAALHVLIILLMLALFIVIAYELYLVFVVEIPSLGVNATIDGILFTLILVELFTILYAYLDKHYIKVERVIEVAIISIVREIIFKVFTMEDSKIYAVAALLLALGVLFLIEKHYSRQRNV